MISLHASNISFTQLSRSGLDVGKIPPSMTLRFFFSDQLARGETNRPIDTATAPSLTALPFIASAAANFAGFYSSRFFRYVSRHEIAETCEFRSAFPTGTPEATNEI